MEDEWLVDIIHLLATEYGWSKRQILDEVYFDELDLYATRIRKNQISERLTETAIANNTRAKDPNKLVKSFEKKLQELNGKDYLAKDRMTKEDERKLKELARRMKANAEKRRKG